MINYMNFNNYNDYYCYNNDINSSIITISRSSSDIIISLVIYQT